MTLRQAALVVGLGLLIMAVLGTFAELFFYARLVTPDSIEDTVRNLRAGRGLFLAGLVAYVILFILDLVVAWGLYVLLAPVHRPLSLLTAWFRLLYTAIAFVAMSKLVTVFRLLDTGDYETAFGADQLHAQVKLLLGSFRYEWTLGLGLFGLHLGLVAYLVFRSGYIPRFLGVLLAIAGAGWVVDSLGPFFYPNADLGFLMITFLGELVFMGWLLIRGWRIEETAAQGDRPGYSTR